MDYGQPVNNQSETVFFTAGVGDAPENLNPDADKSLNDGIYSPDHDPKNLGNTAIFSPETPKTPETPESPEPSEALEISPNQNVEILETQPSQPLQPSQSLVSNIIDPSQFTHENDHISPKTFQACEKATADFTRGATTPADLVNFHDEASEAYRKPYSSSPSEETK